MNKNAPPAQNNSTASPSLARRLWQGTCTRFTLIALMALLVNLLFSGTDSQIYVEPLRFLLFLPFAFCLAVAALVRTSKGLSTGARVALHPICSLGGFYLCLYVPYQIKSKPTGGQMLILLLLALIVYGIAMGILALIGRRSRQKEIDEAPYVSQFGPKDRR